MPIHKIFIDQAVSDNPVTAAVCTRFDIPVEVVDSPESVFDRVAKHNDPEEYGKRILLLTRNKGAFIRDCPGTSHYTCCGYTILHIGTYCVMDCAYCILQAYFHPPVLQLFVNHEEMKTALDDLFQSETITRIGTGEYTDSLIWERIYPVSQTLVPLFAAQSSAVLELKTKTTAIDHLIHLPHNRKTIMAWSVNTERIIASEERATASLDQRLDAASACAARTYPIAFHFDPMVIYDGCETEYAAVVDRIFNRIHPDHIVWMSLGSFRFIPALKPIIERRFSRSKIVYGEFIKGMDGKMRYFKPLRIRLYRHVIERIRKRAPDLCIYFCMEDDEVWAKAMGFLPSAHGGVPHMLDQCAARHCGLNGRFQSG